MEKWSVGSIDFLPHIKSIGGSDLNSFVESLENSGR